MKVFVLADDDELVFKRVCPDRAIRGGRQARVADVDRSWVHVRQRRNKARRQILVEEQTK
jgi:hypothetical protein